MNDIFGCPYCGKKAVGLASFMAIRAMSHNLRCRHCHELIVINMATAKLWVFVFVVGFVVDILLTRMFPKIYRVFDMIFLVACFSPVFLGYRLFSKNKK